MRGNVLILAGFLLLLIVIGLFIVSYNRNLINGVVGLVGHGSGESEDSEPSNVTVRITAYVITSRGTRVLLDLPWFEIDGRRYPHGTSLTLQLEPGVHRITVPDGVGPFAFRRIVVNGQVYYSNGVSINITGNTDVFVYYVISG